MSKQTLNLKRRPPALHPLVRACGILLLPTVIGACSAIQPIIPATLPKPHAADGKASADAESSRPTGPLLSELPVAPTQEKTKFAQRRDARDQQLTQERASAGDEEVAAINLQQVPLPTFIQVVYAEILKRNLNIDPAVLARKELITFRSGASQSTRQFEEAINQLLKSYKLSVLDAGGLVRVVPEAQGPGSLPEIRRDDVSPDTPLQLRPVYQFVEMKVVKQNEVASWLKTLFGDRVKVQEDLARNALVLSGSPDNVQAALEAVRTLDQPLMVGRKSIAITPAYWSADDLARRLSEVLTIQGYSVAPLNQQLAAGSTRFPVVLLPVVGVNAVYVFANSDQVIEHVVNWARTLDRPNERGVGKNFFTYSVKHKDAQDLAKTLDQLLAGRRASVSAATAASVTAQGTPAANAASQTANKFSSVVVDQSSNTLIFQVEPEEYSQISALLQMLDRPAKSALIEVTVAELKVTDEKSSGVEWLYSRAIGGGDTASIGLKSYAATSSPLNFQVLNGANQLRLAIAALAASDRATVLSSPRIHARNGEQALIQVGNEVPILTSQITTPNTGSTTPSNTVVGTVQYRTTGVILKVKPVIHSGDQVDLEVEQEVSNADSTSTGVNNTPTFSTRKLSTKLTLTNGTTVLMGGLITDNGS
ncbi:MAG TPA: secretin N-terminal domain-containing protein, partial [Burkholderiaceae bacterium]|nr:secretin N-terminal domain-containing protein [Burkholderiaceae bacterium]